MRQGTVGAGQCSELMKKIDAKEPPNYKREKEESVGRARNRDEIHGETDGVCACGDVNRQKIEKEVRSIQ